MLRLALLTLACAIVATNAFFLNDAACPATATPMANFQPSSFFSGNWYMVDGAPAPSISCLQMTTSYDANAKSVLFNQIITNTGGQSLNVNGTLVQSNSASSNAVYDFVTSDNSTTTQLTVLDTDNVNYGVVAQCQRGQFAGQSVVVVSRSKSQPANLASIVSALSAAGFPTDAANFGQISTSGCP